MSTAPSAPARACCWTTCCSAGRHRRRRRSRATTHDRAFARRGGAGRGQRRRPTRAWASRRRRARAAWISCRWWRSATTWSASSRRWTTPPVEALLARAAQCRVAGHLAAHSGLSRPHESGKVLSLKQMLPWWKFGPASTGRSTPSGRAGAKADKKVVAFGRVERAKPRVFHARAGGKRRTAHRLVAAERRSASSPAHGPASKPG